MPPLQPFPIKRLEGGAGGPKYVFYFEDWTRDKKHRTNDLVKHFWDKDWLAQNPAHPFAAHVATLRQREVLLDVIKSKEPTIIIAAGKHLGFLRAGCSAEEEIKFFEQLKRERQGRGLLR